MIEVDASKFAKKVQEWQRVVGVSAKEALKTQGRLFVQDCIKLTPPSGQKKGEEKVSRILRKIFAGAHENLINTLMGNPLSNLDSFSNKASPRPTSGANSVDAWFTTKAGHKKHVIWNRVDVTGAGMRAFHRDFNRTPRPLKVKYQNNEWRREYVVPWGVFGEYLKRVQKAVGRMKAGWVPAANTLGAKVPEWVARHASGARGTVTLNLDTSAFSKPSITITNYSKGISRIEKIIKRALKQRVSSIAKDMKLYLAGIKERK